MQMEKENILSPPPLPPLSVVTREKIPNEYMLPSPQEEISNICQRLWKYIIGDNVENCVVSVYHQTRPIIQDGPQCGLVALCMASQLLSRVLTIEEVLNRARILGFTYQGEMFSAHNMSQLAKDLLQCQVHIVVNVKRNQDIIFGHLLHGHPILIPDTRKPVLRSCARLAVRVKNYSDILRYDADGNHEPCCKNGHVAHWAVITGFCIVLNENKHKYKFIGIQDPKLKQLYHWKDNILPVSISDDKQIYVFARHGKSNRIGLWNFVCLCESNSNLKELGAKHIASDFVLPEKGIFCELANHALLLY